MIAKLALEDGCVFTGHAVGSSGTRTGEVVFNTAMTGYQEVFTDPSYCGQIVTMTFPLQGNYGINPDDFESSGLSLSGVVLKEVPRRPSNFRSTRSLPDFLKEHDIIALTGIDTRALTRRIRVGGAMCGVLSTEVLDDVTLVNMAREAQAMSGANLVARVAPSDVTSWSQPLWRGSAFGNGKSTSSSVEVEPAVSPTSKEMGHPSTERTTSLERTRAESGGQATNAPHVVAIDCGIKHNILRHLTEEGCRVTVAPADLSAAELRDLEPDGIMVGNGPGDPAAVGTTIETLRELIGTLPIFGVCLGHQLLALALGAKTYKLSFGHHGANLPVLRKPSGRVEITSQNHGFAVDVASLERVGGTATHVNLNDESLEGFVHADRQVMAVQYHPEASPGPHDAAYLFDRFVSVVRGQRSIDHDLLS